MAQLDATDVMGAPGRAHVERGPGWHRSLIKEPTTDTRNELEGYGSGSVGLADDRYLSNGRPSPQGRRLLAGEYDPPNGDSR